MAEATADAMLQSKLHGYREMRQETASPPDEMATCDRGVKDERENSDSIHEVAAAFDLGTTETAVPSRHLHPG